MMVTAMIIAKDVMTRIEMMVTTKKGAMIHIEIAMVIIREDVMTKMNVGMAMTSIKTSVTGGIKEKRIVTETMTGIDSRHLNITL